MPDNPANDDRFSLLSETLVGRLDCWISAVIERIRHSRTWQDLTERTSNPALAAAYRQELRETLGRCRPNAAATAEVPDDATIGAVCAVWRGLAHRKRSHAYLGALYAFEAITTLLMALPDPDVRDDPRELRDRSLLPTLRGLLCEVVTQDPAAAGEIERGIDWMEHVYPMPLLEAARAA